MMKDILGSEIKKGDKVAASFVRTAASELVVGRVVKIGRGFIRIKAPSPYSSEVKNRIKYRPSDSVLILPE